MFNKALTWGILYLLLIPIFAIFYTFLPNEFYQSTIKYEKTYKSFINSIQELLKQNIQNSANIKTIQNGKYPIDHKVNLHIDNINVRNLEIIDDVSFSFEIQTSIVDENTMIVSPIVAKVIVSGLHRSYYTDEDEIKLVPFTVQPYTHFNYKTKSNYYAIEHLLYSSTIEFLKNTSCLKLNNIEYSKLLKLYRAGQGLIHELPFNFIRMLYFSAVTMTTLGYGDIVPVSNLSRLLITIQTVLGIICIGVFLSKLKFVKK